MYEFVTLPHTFDNRRGRNAAGAIVPFSHTTFVSASYLKITHCGNVHRPYVEITQHYFHMTEGDFSRRFFESRQSVLVCVQRRIPFRTVMLACDAEEARRVREPGETAVSECVFFEYVWCIVLSMSR
jgi:hypothetical protein